MTTTTRIICKPAMLIRLIAFIIFSYFLFNGCKGKGFFLTSKQNITFFSPKLYFVSKKAFPKTEYKTQDSSRHEWIFLTLKFALGENLFCEGKKIICEGEIIFREGVFSTVEKAIGKQIVSSTKSCTTFQKSWWRIGATNYYLIANKFVYLHREKSINHR